MKKSSSLERIEDHLQRLDPSSFRYKALDAARRFKSSWVELGQLLFTVYQDKLYRDWGYLTFEAYCSKEVGIRQPTAVKLLKSYSFLEKEEPAYLHRDGGLSEAKPNQIPSVDLVNALRLAKASGRVPESQYKELRDDVLENGREEAEVKKKIRYILKASPRSGGEPEPEAKSAAMNKLFIYLKNSKAQGESLHIPAKILKKIDELLELLADYQGKPPA